MTDDISQLIHASLDELTDDFDTVPGTPWATRRESFVQTLRSRGTDTHPVMERLLQRLDDSADDDRKSMLVSGQLGSEADELISQHAASQDQGQAQAAAPAPAYDPDAWYAYLRESGWRWDGTDEAWGPFRDWIVYDADQRGLGAPTKALMDELTTDAAGERIAKLAQYGVTIAVPARQSTGEPAGPAPGEPAAPAVTGADVKQVMDDLIAGNPRFGQIPEERRAVVAAEALRLARSRGRNGLDDKALPIQRTGR